jgi:hypothetical protein
MAKQKNNVVTHGLSGKVGDLLIFRQIKGKTVVSKIPEMPKTATEKQKASRRRFQQATLYAKQATKNPVTRDLYAAAANKGKDKGRTAYNVAVADFYNAPDIDTIDVSSYAGAVGDEIRVIASDDFLVKSCHIQIIDADGSTVEEGEAVNSAGNLWIYAATQNNESLESNKIIVTVSDLPGNITQEERSI